MKQLYLAHKLKGVAAPVSVFVLLSVVILPLDFTGDRTDGIFHYLIAKTALKYPSYFFDLWGKPIFTLTAMPFAQFGFRGMHFMNVLIATATAWLVFLTAQRLKFRHAWLAYFLVLLTPVYFQQLYTMMTEPLFALWLAWIIFLFVDEKPASAAVFASLSPLVRQEGYFLIVLMLFIYLWKGYYRFLPHLLLGLLLFSFLGFLFQGDFFILINRNPYNGEDLYGHGSFAHFFERAEIMFGVVLEVLFLVGCVLLMLEGMRLRKQLEAPIKTKHSYHSRLLLVAGFSVGFFMAHVVMWWKGIFSSYGLERVMACIVPAMAIVALNVIDCAGKFLENKKRKTVSIVAAVLIALTSMGVFFSRAFFPPRKQLTLHELVLTEAADWVKSNQISFKKVYFSHPFNILLYNLNPKERKDSDELMYVGQVQNMDSGALIVWDSAFGPTNRFEREQLSADRTVLVLKSMRTENYEVLICKKK